jgi:transcriptional regulator GlxA family with amidase domain
VLAILSFGKTAIHLTSVFCLGPASPATFIEVDDRAADAENLAGKHMIVFGVVPGVCQKAIDSDSSAGITQNRTQQGSVLAGTMKDRDVAQAIAFIRSHAAKPIQVADVLREVALSRRQFERRFQTILGRTPAAEIRRVHMERAMQLLIDSEMPIPDVASAAGFASREYMAQVFKQELGLSPLRYRLRDRGR